eukprot:TRINITY_DN61742_c0_g1_i1.p1 TRINITY_DN61742_c0_g1~~TRINITY_DN61742_c0_g1_i1.p1  ORF type:complete len:256 (+),score=41.81 TRINITY_DN61742_c0_g1_i1:125-892(+)
MIYAAVAASASKAGRQRLPLPGLLRFVALSAVAIAPRLSEAALAQTAGSARWFAALATVTSSGFRSVAGSSNGNSGTTRSRDEAIEAVIKSMKEHFKGWKRPSNKELIANGLTELQVQVSSNDGTEPPFRNAYWNNHEAGVYVDVVSGEPLYSSADKFDSGSGWPSFTRSLPGADLETAVDFKLRSARTEIRSPIADSHLGHVFDDGPRDKGGMRHCVNSASVRFIPLAKMDEEGLMELRRALFPEHEGATNSEL